MLAGPLSDMLNNRSVHPVNAAHAKPCAAMPGACWSIQHMALDVPAVTAADIVTQGAEGRTHMLIFSCSSASSCCYQLNSCHCAFAHSSSCVQSAKKRKKSGGADTAEDAEAAAAAALQSQSLTAESYTPPDPGPYPQDKPPENSVRFTPVQVGASCLPLCSWWWYRHVSSSW